MARVYTSCQLHIQSLPAKRRSATTTASIRRRPHLPLRAAAGQLQPASPTSPTPSTCTSPNRPFTCTTTPRQRPQPCDVPPAPDNPPRKPSDPPPEDPPSIYAPPTSGLIARLPPSCIPYAELMRLDKPTGTYYLFLPCLFSTLLAAPLAEPITPPLTVLSTTMLFFGGALVMRGAGCTINDLWDRNLDPHVARTRLRPIARRAIAPAHALAFLALQLLTGGAILLLFPPAVLPVALPSLALVALYPLAKRLTHYPQLMLGLTFSWGSLLGFPALGVALAHNPAALLTAASLYAGCVAWTVVYDMVYAFQDIRDDARAGIRSIALRHAAGAKRFMLLVCAAQCAVLGLGVVGARAVLEEGWVWPEKVAYGAGLLAGGGILARIVLKVDLTSPRSCAAGFRGACWGFGGLFALGAGVEYAVEWSGVLARARERRRQERASASAP